MRNDGRFKNFDEFEPVVQWHSILSFPPIPLKNSVSTMSEGDGLGLSTLEHPTAPHLVVPCEDAGRTDWISLHSRMYPVHPDDVNLLTRYN
jgi:hypothetical protein